MEIWVTAGLLGAIVILFVDGVVLQRGDERALRVPWRKRFTRWVRQAWDLFLSM